MTIGDARALVEFFTDAGFEVTCCGGSGYVGAIAVFKGSNLGPIEFVPFLPDGTFYETGG